LGLEIRCLRVDLVNLGQQGHALVSLGQQGRRFVLFLDGPSQGFVMIIDLKAVALFFVTDHNEHC